VLARCSGTHCARHELSAELVFAPAPDGGQFLTRIDVTRHDGACNDAYDGP
jgi:hypothetical protein